MRNLVIRIVLACVLVFGCVGQSLAAKSNGPALLPTTEARNAAAGFAVTQGIYLVRFYERCKAEGDPVASDFWDALNSWGARNNMYVKASNDWVRYVFELIKAKDGEDAAKAFIQSAGTDFNNNADAAVQDRFVGASSGAAVCSKWATILRGSESDLQSSKEFAPALVEIYEFFQAIDAASEVSGGGV